MCLAMVCFFPQRTGFLTTHSRLTTSITSKVHAALISKVKLLEVLAVPLGVIFLPARMAKYYTYISLGYTCRYVVSLEYRPQKFLPCCMDEWYTFWIPAIILNMLMSHSDMIVKCLAAIFLCAIKM